MNWEHIRLIFLRELRDQLRDRRTLFTIAVLPLLLYPVMGMILLQILQFHREQTVKVEVFGYENWGDVPPLVQDNAIAEGLLSPDERNLLEFVFPQESNASREIADWKEIALKRIGSGMSDLVLFIPKDFSDRMHSLVNRSEEDRDPHRLPAVYVFGNRVSDRSMVAERRVSEAIACWQREWLFDQLDQVHIQRRVVDPIEITSIDVAPPANRNAILWSKLLPFVMLVWALTGAFYPAIDLCAGEKERGTLETLLSSPARRKEIVWGKLLVVVTFSVGTALLNLVSMQWTSSMMMRQFSRIHLEGMASAMGPLPLSSIGWLIIMLLPISALFSALALAIASLARSSKEGQYYLMPLLLVGMPLVMIPMMPGVTLSLGTSVVPVTGAVLLSRSLLEGEYHEALIHLPFVIAVTVGACWLAIRWAVGQFESESVLFRENERFSLQLWLRHVWRDRGATASVSESLFCGFFILVSLFFGRLMATEPRIEWTAIARSVVLIQVGLILAPSLVMATMLTRSLRESLRIHVKHWGDIPMAAILAVGLHPLFVLFASLVQAEFAVGEQTRSLLHQYDIAIGVAPLASVLLVLAVLPAICEEIAFRGFVFGGLLEGKGIVRAVVVSSLFFGLSHGLLQQSITATLMGVLLGYLAYRSGGVLTSIAFHAVHNALSMSLARLQSHSEALPGYLSPIFTPTEDGIAYSTSWILLGSCVTLLAFLWFYRRQPSPLLDRMPTAAKPKAQAT